MTPPRSAAPAPLGVSCTDLADPARLRSLAEAGLSADPDPDMDLFAGRVRRWLGVPVALVSLVHPEEQVFPGASGLPEPLDWERRTPLTHSFCQHVVMSAKPLIVEDAREHELVADNAAIRDLGVIAYAGFPLTDGAGNVLGSLCALDMVPRRWDPTQLDALEDLARMCSVALRLRLATVDADRERQRRDELDARLRQQLQSRTTATHILQRAMLATLPKVGGLTMAAHYAPADSREDVGGDWYDVVRLPARDGDDDDRGVLVLSVGDIAGHTLSAATEMGQVRSMLRQATWDRAGEPPSGVVAAFEDADDIVGPRARGTLVLAHLQEERDGTWAMTWSNAGHPPPILLAPGRPPQLLDGVDPMFGFPHLLLRPRTDARVAVPAGSLLFLHTDGLVERRGEDLDVGTARLVERLDQLRDEDATTLPERVVAELSPGEDDVVALAVRVGA
ncbi:PP2C family protein-serine/threonine phosphatase [Actinomycetospora sp. CA-101289]|uniref:PP2C family protein-serine/threonine phosphatase n=1 Tax=Actinomycetospora sp. CA-101289 TaxID=3239893 RepID=UPI003D9725E5